MRLGWPGTVLLLSGALLLPREARPAAPVVRFLEVGERGTVFPDAPLFADVEVWSDAPFSGSLVATLRYGDPRTAGAPRTFVSDRALHRLVLSTGERRRVNLVFPESTTSWSGEKPPLFVEISWRLLDASGREVTRGAEPAKSIARRESIIFALTREAVPWFHRLPEDAYTSVSRYQPFKLVLVSAADLATLSCEQGQALWDAAATGLSVIIVGPFRSAGAPWDDLFASEQTVWADGNGAEIRETPFLSGRVRRTNLPILPPPRLDGVDDPRFVGYALATTPGGVLAHPRFGRVTAFSPWVDDYVRTHQKKQTRRPLAHRARAVAVAASLLLAGVFFALWTVSRPGSPLRRRPALGVLLAALIPFAGLGVFSRQPIGHIDGRTDICLHDTGGRAAIRRTVRIVGGGGGARRIGLAARVDARTRLEARRGADVMTSPRMTVETDDAELLTFSVGPDAWTATNVVQLRTDRVTSVDRAWEPTLGWTGDRVAGSITFRHGFRSAALVANAVDSNRPSVVRLGAVRSGETIDIGRFPLGQVSARWWIDNDLAQLLGLEAYTLPVRLEMFRQLERGLILIAEEESHAGRVLHVEELPVEIRRGYATMSIPMFSGDRGTRAFIPSYQQLTIRWAPWLARRGLNQTPYDRLPGPGHTEFVYGSGGSTSANSSRPDLPQGVGYNDIEVEVAR